MHPTIPSDIPVSPGRVYLVQGAVGITPFARAVASTMAGPIRAPHHTCSQVAAVSELALAAGGVLFLDEVPEFRRTTLDAVIRTWRMMHAPTRPALVLGLAAGRCPPALRDANDAATYRRLEAIADVLPSVDEHVLTDLGPLH